MPEKSGLDMALRLSLPAGCAAGKIACAQAGVEIADTIATNKRKFSRCTFMLPSLSWLPRQLSDKVYTLHACMEEVRNCLHRGTAAFAVGSRCVRPWPDPPTWARAS